LNDKGYIGVEYKLCNYIAINIKIWTCSRNLA